MNDLLFTVEIYNEDGQTYVHIHDDVGVGENHKVANENEIITKIRDYIRSNQ